MVNLTGSDIQIINRAFQADPGYCLNFTDPTFRAFFEDEFRVDIDDTKYQVDGISKMKRLRTFCKVEDGVIVGKVLRGLLKHRSSFTHLPPLLSSIEQSVQQLISKVEGSNSIAKTDALVSFERSETLGELIASIERDILADKPQIALDRLHTYCQKKFAYLIEKKTGTKCDRDEPLNSRYGKYVKSVVEGSDISAMSKQILKSFNPVLEKFNFVRNNQSAAHDNELLDKAEARFIFDSISAILRFIQTIETVAFDS
jgi:Abortive infection C-terminus